MISFIVPAFNEECLLGRTLEAIQEAARDVDANYELIVVDDNSSDSTGTLAYAHGATVIRVNHRQISATRNSGARAASGQVFIFVDADTVISPEILHSTLAAIDNKSIGGGAAFRFDGYVPIHGRVVQWLLHRLSRLAKLGGGCYLFCTREVFERVGGFDETVYGGEEIILTRSLKKLGRFTLLRQTVLTSGRRLRIYSVWEIIRIIARLAMSCGRVEDRNSGWFWYDGRRED